MMQVYFYCSLLEDNVKESSLPAAVKASVSRLIRSRWDYLHSDLHGAAFCMDPEFWEAKLNSEVCKLPRLKLLSMCSTRSAVRVRPAGSLMWCR